VENLERVGEESYSHSLIVGSNVLFGYFSPCH
jgi:hypothetical protein